MSSNKTEKTIKLILFLSKNPQSSKTAIIRELDCDERTFFNYIHTIRNLGFILKCKGGRYTLSNKNETAHTINQLSNINSEEILLLHSVVNKLDISESKKFQIIEKLANTFTVDHFEKIQQPNVLEKIQKSIHEKKNVIIRKHSSKLNIPHHFVAEIYKLDKENIYCWIYIPTENKNYRLRIVDINILSNSIINWMYTSKHQEIESDALGEYGHLQFDVSISLTKEGTYELIHSYPKSKIFISKENKHYIFEASLSNYLQISIFILIHQDHVISINKNEHREFINNWLNEKMNKLNSEYISSEFKDKI
ncbi:MAG: hypothetical protein WBG43_11630 [Marinifilaceae bacterium]